MMRQVCLRPPRAERKRVFRGAPGLVDSWTPGRKCRCHRHSSGPLGCGLPWTPSSASSVLSPAHAAERTYEGVAVAWSLADTRMRILCLEQGDWVRSTDFPANGRDWEARRASGGDWDIRPNFRGRETDYPVNDDNSIMKVANFNGVG